MFHLTVYYKLFAFIFIANCYVRSDDDKRCSEYKKNCNFLSLSFTRLYPIHSKLKHVIFFLSFLVLGTRDYKILSERKEPSTIKFPWFVDIYQFHYFRAKGISISSKHILVSASHIIPYKGSALEPLDSEDGLPPYFW